MGILGKGMSPNFMQQSVLLFKRLWRYIRTLLLLSIHVISPYGLSQKFPKCDKQYLRVSPMTSRGFANTAGVNNFDKLNCIFFLFTSFYVIDWILMSFSATNKNFVFFKCS